MVSPKTCQQAATPCLAAVFTGRIHLMSVTSSISWTIEGQPSPTGLGESADRRIWIRSGSPGRSATNSCTATEDLARALEASSAHSRRLTRLSGDPRCYWQPPRRRLLTRGVLVCRRYFRFFRRVADKSPPRSAGNHPNPFAIARKTPLMAEADKICCGCDNDRPRRSRARLNRILRLFLCRTSQVPSHQAAAFQPVMELAPTARLRER
jgi:hypothetical protein